MDLINKILDSKVVKASALIVGLLAGIAKLADSTIPNAAKPIVVFCLICVGIYFFLVFIQFLVRNELGRLPSQPDDIDSFVSDCPSDEEAYIYMAKRYGIGHDLTDVKCDVNKDGSSIVQRVIEVEAYSQIGDIDTYLLIPPDSPPIGKQWNLSLGTIRSLTAGRNVTPDEIKEELGRTSVQLKISPPLFDGSSVTYEMKQELPSQFYAVGYTREELAKRETPDDYFGWNINRPTRKLLLRISFPKHSEPQVYGAEVRYASASGFPAVRIQYEEQKRLRPKLESEGDGRFALKLDVSYPMPGLIYILRWQPVPAETNLVSITSLEPEKDEAELEYLSELRQILSTRLSEGELRILYFDLGVDYSSLSGKTLSDKVIELIEHLRRRNQIPKIIEIGKLQRPDINWPAKK